MREFFESIGDRLSGKSKQISYESALATQKEIAAQVLAEQLQQNQLKYNPELSKQRTLQITVVSIAVVAGIVVLIYIFK